MSIPDVPNTDAKRAAQEAKWKELDMLRHGLVESISRGSCDGFWKPAESVGSEGMPDRRVYERPIDVNHLPSLDDYDGE